MILLSLTLTSFGCFQKREICLSEGLNLFEAENEAGKSTIAAFIAAMLYGFFQRDVKRRAYTEAYFKYLPWENPNQYCGVMRLRHEGRDYRLERNFLKGSDAVRLLDDVTGEDLTALLPYNKTLRIHEPGEYFLGVSHTAFLGTLCIAQQGCAPGDRLGSDLSDRIAALSQAGSDGISVSGALKWLDARKAEIGTRKRSASLLGAAVNRLDELRAERSEAESRHMNAAEYALRQHALHAQAAGLRARQSETAALLARARQARLADRSVQARTLQDQIEESRRIASECAEASGIDAPAVEETLAQLPTLESLRRQQNDEAAALTQAHKALSDIDSEIDRCGMDEAGAQKATEITALAAAVEMREKDFHDISLEVKILMDDINALPIENPDETESAIQEYRVLDSGAHLLPLPWLISGSATLLLGALALLYPFLWAALPLGAGLLLFGLRQFRRKKAAQKRQIALLDLLHISSPAELDGRAEAARQCRDLNRRYGDACDARNRATEAYDLARTALNAALQSAHVQTREQFDKRLTQYQALCAQRQEQAVRIGMAEEKLRALKNSVGRMEGLLQETLQSCSAHDADHLRTLLVQNRRWQEEQHRQSQLGQELMRLLNGEAYAAFFQRVGALTPDPEGMALDPELLSAEERRLNAELNECLREEAVCAARAESAENHCRALSEIQCEIEEVQAEIDSYERNLRAIDQATERIVSLSEALRRQVAPRLNEAVSRLSNEITGGRYSQLRVGTDLQLQAFPFGRAGAVAPDQLSAGTSDAVYLALRLGLIDFLMDDMVCPVLLDDSLVQLDDTRAGHMLRVLASESRRRQLLLFTCHTRERRMLAEMGLSYSIVQL